MQYIDKIYKLHNILNSRRTGISGKAIDQLLDCNKSTRCRIIKDLRDRLGAPLELDRSKGGYYYDRSNPNHIFELPGIWLNAEELHALIACQHVLANLAPGLLHNEIGQLREHLERLLNKTPGINPPQLSKIKILSQAYRSRNDPVFMSVVEALFKQNQLEIVYFARSDNQTSRRNISPQNLVLYKDNWYLDGYCHSRNELRTFALDRIKNVEIQKQPAHAIHSEEINQHYGSSYGIFAGVAKHIAVLNFNKHAANWVADETWHSQQQSEWLSDGRYQLRIPFNRHEELLMDILKWGAEVEVMEPEFLRELVRERVERMLVLYR